MIKRLNHEQIVEDYSKGMSGMQLAKKNCCYYTTIYKILKSNNISCRPASDSARKYYINENFFHLIDTEYKAYVLGFITADGNINNNGYAKKLNIGLHKKDDIILYDILKCMDTNYPVNYSKRLTYISITSDLLCDDILRIWKLPLSKDRLPYYDIDSFLLPHYIRGILDGDGWISKGKNNKFELGFCGYYPIIEFLYEVFLNKFDINLKIHPKKSIYTLQITTINHIGYILDWIYQDCNITLERKKEVYHNFMEYNFLRKPPRGTTRKDNVWLEYNGVIKTQAQWARYLNIKPYCIKDKLSKGKSFNDIIEFYKDIEK